ncbi:solute carrier family 25 protein [archaeon]|nr:MAG: solute carrier family 25 protein [archaeon]
MNITCWFLLSFVSLQYIFASAHVFVRVDWKSALAGGLAGGIATSIIFPIDTVKTMLQTNPRITTLSGVLEHLKAQSFGRIYSGFFPAVLGSILSSSLYFGTYEATKSFMYARCNLTNRHFIHGIAATTGNIASSFVFVPKETIKQQLQAFKTGILGIPGIKLFIEIT